MSGVVWIAEDQAFELDDHFYLGTFSGHLDMGRAPRPDEQFEALSLDEALSWARQRSPRVRLRLATGDYYSAGSEPSREYAAWPPDDLPAIRKRRPQEEEWKDRTEADAAIEWVVEVDLTPPEIRVGVPFVAAIERWEATVAEVARAAGAQRWDDDEIKRFSADIGPADGGWVSEHETFYRLWFLERASTREHASEQALRRCAPPEDWTLEAGARPA